MRKHECPKCAGQGVQDGVLIGGELRSVPCQFCDATGMVCGKRLAWAMLGESLRNHRMKVLGLTLRKLGAIKNISPTHLSLMEQGIREPKPMFYDGFTGREG